MTSDHINWCGEPLARDVTITQGQRIGDLESSVYTINSKIEDLQINIKDLSKKMEVNQVELSESQKVNESRFLSLEARMDSLTTLIQSQATTLDKILHLQMQDNRLKILDSGEPPPMSEDITTPAINSDRACAMMTQGQKIADLESSMVRSKDKSEEVQQDLAVKIDLLQAADMESNKLHEDRFLSLESSIQAMNASILKQSEQMLQPHETDRQDMKHDPGDPPASLIQQTASLISVQASLEKGVEVQDFSQPVASQPPPSLTSLPEANFSSQHSLPPAQFQSAPSFPPSSINVNSPAPSLFPQPQYVQHQHSFDNHLMGFNAVGPQQIQTQQSPFQLSHQESIGPNQSTSMCVENQHHLLPPTQYQHQIWSSSIPPHHFFPPPLAQASFAEHQSRHPQFNYNSQSPVVSPYITQTFGPKPQGPQWQNTYVPYSGMGLHDHHSRPPQLAYQLLNQFGNPYIAQPGPHPQPMPFDPGTRSITTFPPA